MSSWTKQILEECGNILIEKKQKKKKSKKKYILVEVRK